MFMDRSLGDHSLCFKNKCKDINRLLHLLPNALIKMIKLYLSIFIYLYFLQKHAFIWLSL